MNNEKRAEAAGTYTVTLGTPWWERLETKMGDECRMALVVPCDWTSPEGTAYREYYRMYFTQQIIQRGKNSGRTMARVSAEECIRLGMPEPFDPGKIDALAGQVAELVVQEEEYQGEKRLVPRYLNPRRASAMSTDDARALWAKMVGDAPTAAETSSDELF
mgnify:CR=1 FL=1